MEKIETNLDRVKEFMQQRESDWLHITVGSEGVGKSTLNLAMSLYFDDSFSAERVHFDGQSFRNQAMELEPLQAITHDELVEDAYKREAMASNVRKMIKFLRKCRFLQLFITGSLPSIAELDKDLWKGAEPRVRSLARVVEPGWAHFYSQSTMKKIEIKKDGSIDWPDPDYRDSFPNVQTEYSSFWEDYMEKKKRDISDTETEEEHDLSVDEMVKVVKNKQDRYKREYNDRQYLEWEVISHDFDIGEPTAKKVKKIAEADLGLN